MMIWMVMDDDLMRMRMMMMMMMMMMVMVMVGDYGGR